jgi:hypothetical protein
MDMVVAQANNNSNSILQSNRTMEVEVVISSLTNRMVVINKMAIIIIIMEMEMECHLR